MKRWGLAFALLLSLGVNLGVLGMMAVHRLHPGDSRTEVAEGPSRSSGTPSGGSAGQLPTDGIPSRPPGSSTEPAPGMPAGPVQSSGRPPGTPTDPVQSAGRSPGSSSASGQTAGRPPDRSPEPGQDEDRLPDRPPRRSPDRSGSDRSDAMPQMRLQRLADHLGLQGEVRERFIVQQREFFRATARDRMRLRAIHAELRRELASSEPDRARTEQLTQEASRTYLELERAMVANVLTTREMLDPEQERLFQEFVGRRGAGRLTAPESGERRFPPRRRRRPFFERY